MDTETQNTAKPDIEKGYFCDLFGSRKTIPNRLSYAIRYA